MKLFKTFARLTLLCLLSISANSAIAKNIFVTLDVFPPDQNNNTLDATISTSGYVTASTIFGDIQVDIANSDSDSATVSGNFDAGMIIDFDESKNAIVNSFAFNGGNVAMSDTEFTFDYGALGSINVANTNIAGYPGTYPPGLGTVTGTAFEVSEHYAVVNQGSTTIYGTGLASGMFDQTIDFGAEPSTTDTVDSQGSLVVSYDYSIGNLDYYTVEMVIPVDINQTVITQADPVAGYDVQIDLEAAGMIRAQGSFAVNSCPNSGDLAENDCIVGINDLQVMTNQWLESSSVLPCPLSADIGENDCAVNLADFAILSSQWMTIDQE